MLRIFGVQKELAMDFPTVLRVSAKEQNLDEDDWKNSDRK